MTTQYQAPEQQDPRPYGQGQESAWEQRAWQQPAWQQPGRYAARRSTPWGVIMAVGAAIIVACTLALVYLFGHLAGPAQGGDTAGGTGLGRAGAQAGAGRGREGTSDTAGGTGLGRAEGYGAPALGHANWERGRDSDAPR